MINNEKVIKIENLLGYVINRTAIQLKTVFQRELKARGFDITPEHWAILFTLEENDGLYQKQLADKLLKDKPNITRMLDLLEKRELIIRKNDNNDRRIIKVFLTEKGRQHIKEVTPLAKELMFRVQSIITKDEYETLITLLNKLYDGVLMSEEKINSHKI